MANAFLRSLCSQFADGLLPAVSPSTRAAFDLYVDHATHWIVGMYHDPEFYTAPGTTGYSFIALPKNLYTRDDARTLIDRFVSWNHSMLGRGTE
jgi:hypothetical protein